MPDWYNLVKAASYYGIKPWELAEQPEVWTHWANCAASAEAQAEAERAAAMWGGKSKKGK